jgi:hypothetical protein
MAPLRDNNNAFVHAYTDLKRLFRFLFRMAGQALTGYPQVMLAFSLLATTSLALQWAPDMPKSAGGAAAAADDMAGAGIVKKAVNFVLGYDAPFFWAYCLATLTVLVAVYCVLGGLAGAEGTMLAVGATALLMSIGGVLCSAFVNVRICSVMDSAASAAREATAEGAARRRTYLYSGTGVLFSTMVYVALNAALAVVF